MDVLALPVITMPATVPVRSVTVRMTRDGGQTLERKTLLLLTQELSVQAVFFTASEATQHFAAAAVDGPWLLMAIDSTAPRRAAARHPIINEDVTMDIDLNDGSGGGTAGQPATLAARIRVAGVDAAREVLAVERQIDGDWRVAGSLRTANGSLDLRVTTGGEVYALALDDYGYFYQPNLAVAVGDTIRPTVYTGWLYRITEAGVLPAAEPEWWPADGDNASRPLGTGRAIAVRYYQPLAAGPLPVEVL